MIKRSVSFAGDDTYLAGYYDADLLLLTSCPPGHIFLQSGLLLMLCLMLVILLEQCDPMCLLFMIQTIVHSIFYLACSMLYDLHS